ncbi:hypothetical protein VTN31DRAFT_3767 [Thermomyces dupontii]|uniref:uncharacterized protein n=1 Tax=Talaromyces thermophilus TaxID=28565 RepID=UPI0037441D8B
MSTISSPSAQRVGGDGDLGGGGFLTSPAPSNASAATITPSGLPRQRAHRLRSGSAKESALINHVDAAIRRINRRHAKKFSSAYSGKDEAETEDTKDQKEADVPGYESFKEVAEDVDRIVDILWVSGTPSLQIPYLISVAGLVKSFLPSYPLSVKTTLRLLKKLDRVFASLLLGHDVDDGTVLSGFENRRNVVSMTEKVRIKSIAEATRLAVVDLWERGGEEEEKGEQQEEEEEDSEDAADGVDGEEMDGIGMWEMQAARIYERTIQILGDELGKTGFT